MNAIAIPMPSQFSFEECLWFLDRNYDECLHSIEGNTIVKAISLDGEPVLFQISKEENQVLIRLLGQSNSERIQSQVKSYVKTWLDVDRNIHPFYALLQRHSRLKYMVKEFHGLRLITIPDLFEALCWCIIGQQINLAFAYKVKRRLVETYGKAISYNGMQYFLFPSPDKIAQLTITDLKALQFSRQKAAYIIGIAQLFASDQLSKQQIERLPNREEQLKTLQKVRGIGVWTANYALMKSIPDMNCITYGDVGLLAALENHQLIKDRKDRESLDKLFAGFQNWESYLVIYLWRSLTSPNA